MPASTSPKVFISYAHSNGDKGEQHKQQVLAFANQLRSDGVNVLIDQQIADPPEGWPLWMNQQLKRADIVLLIITETYSKRIEGEEKEGIGKGCKFEGRLVYTAIHESDSRNNKFLPVLFHQENAQYVPLLLKGNSHYLVNSELSYNQLLQRIFNYHQAYTAPLGETPKFEQKEPTDFFGSFNTATTPEPKNTKINLSHLPESNYTTLVGREAELTLMDRAWGDNSTRILSLIAWGGVGKTALMREWIDRLSESNYCGASHVFAYSFYSQGSNDDRQVSSDIFFREAFHHLGVTDAEIPDSEYEKGAKLAEVINQHKVLLLLDGLEPLQFAPNDTNGDKAIVGKLKDSAIEALLKNLAAQNSGLVVLSSRLSVQELQTRRFAQQHDLNNLSNDAGVALLNSVELEGVTITGPKQAFTDAVNELQGHALSLTLLASYLCTVCDGDIRKRDTIGDLLDDENNGAHTKRVLDAYIHWFAHQNEQQAPWHIEQNILCLMSLFDRPVTQTLIDALLAVEPLAGITDHLHHLPAPKWKFALQRLQKLRLINNQNPEQLDCHPLIRDYFTKFVAQQFPSSYQQAHECLYDYYKALPEKELPDTLEAMQPLFSAVAHGCKAGLQQRVMDEVYWSRISRKEEFFSTYTLGAFTADLACLAHFFDCTWILPSKALSKYWQAAVRHWAIFRLRGLSRSQEIIELVEVEIEQYIQEYAFNDAADNANILSEIHLSLGNIREAIDAIEKALELVDMGGDKFLKIRYQTTYAEILFSNHKLQHSLKLFTLAEQSILQSKRNFKYLCSLEGFRYCVFFLSKEDWKSVIDRAHESLNLTSDLNWLFETALDLLSKGNAYLKQTQQQFNSSILKISKLYLDDALQKLRDVGAAEFIVRGLISRVSYYTFIKQHQYAWKDLQEAFEIAYFGGMRLFLTEYHLLAAENLLAQLVDTDWVNYVKIENDETLKLSEAALHTHLTQHLHEAEALIEQTDYRLKVPTLNRLQYEYAEQTLSTAAFKQQLAEDSQLQAGKKEIERQKALVAGNKAVYVCREILANVERGEVEVNEQLKAEFLQQLTELKQQVEIADDFYRRPIMSELAAASLVAELISEAELSEQLFNEEEITSIQIKVEELQDQKLEKQKEIEEVNDLISQIKKEDPETYRELEEAALSYASEIGTSFEEALQTLLIDAIRQAKEKASQEESGELTEEQMWQLRESAIQMKNEIEMDDPDQFEELKVAAKAVVEEFGVDMEEAMIVVLMKAIQEGQKG